eukprot:TRINITY_DN11437_c0_g1_i1.p1 TRINITY_DN11437_c0_g1~~TRINITY_DN11437_c0_g1_i1.p1  ORF type:complete len:591 (+),score=88.60 TRINITY_DN11437_c0_g1_i1:116-1888(+)
MRQLFQAYDIDRSGYVDFAEFVKLEIRHGIEQGDIKRIREAFPQMTVADRLGMRRLKFADFYQSRLRSYTDSSRQSYSETLQRVPTDEELTKLALVEAKRTLEERARMGPRYHPELRQELKNLFRNWNFAGGGKLRVVEWIMARSSVESVEDESIAAVSEKWLGEDSFRTADVTQAGAISLDDFLELSFKVLGAIFMEVTTSLQMLRQVRLNIDGQWRGGVATVKVALHLMHEANFQAPGRARYDPSAYAPAGVLYLPAALVRLGDLTSVLRLQLDLPSNVCFSAFHRDNSGSSKAAIVRLTEAGLRTLVEDMSRMPEASADFGLYIKNIRPKTRNLKAFRPQEEEACAAALCFQTGMRWILDWEVQLLSKGSKVQSKPRLPPDLCLCLGDALVIKIPAADSGISASVYMDAPGVLSVPIRQCTSKDKKNVVATKSDGSAAAAPSPEPPAGPAPQKRGRSARAVKARGPPAETQLVFIAQGEGPSVLFVELSWDQLEEDLSGNSLLGIPSSDASVARIGPMKVTVQRQQPFRTKTAGAAAWWNGQSKWAAKPIGGRGKALGAGSYRPMSAGGSQRPQLDSPIQWPQSGRR